MEGIAVMNYRTIILLGAISIFFLVIQLLFFFKAERTVIKYVPVYIIILAFLFSMLLYFGVFGTGFLSAERIFASLVGVGIGAALVGEALAWIVYKILKGRRL